jgi:hypothetical protein
VCLTDRNIGFDYFDFFVNVSTFLKSSFPYPSQTPVPWEAWGPQNTRWFQRYDGQANHKALHGQRTAEAVPCEVLGEYESGDDNMRKERRLRVRDFNPNAVRHSALGQVEKGWKCQAVTTPSTIFSEAYEENIISSLPYTEVTSQETFCAASVFISGSQLLLPNVSKPWASFPVQAADHAAKLLYRYLRAGILKTPVPRR